MQCIIEYNGNKYYGNISSHSGSTRMYVSLYEDKARKKLFQEFDLGMLEIIFADRNQMSIFGLEKDGGVYEPYHFEVTRLG